VERYGINNPYYLLRRDEMKDSELRSLIVKNRTRIKDLMLSESQMQIVKSADKGVKTSWLAEALNITAQNASGRLNKLFWMGYLVRTSTTAKSGGVEYLYTTSKL